MKEVKNPEKMPIPQLERYLAHLKRQRTKLDKYIKEYEADIDRRKALPDIIKLPDKKDRTDRCNDGNHVLHV